MLYFITSTFTQPIIPKISINLPMDSTNNDVLHDFAPFFKVYKDGSVERRGPNNFVPPGLDPDTNVQSKDVLVSAETGVKARIFMPQLETESSRKLPLLVHYHGGGFCVGSSFSNMAKKYLTEFVKGANVIAITIDYRLAPEHPLPIAYEDAFSGLQWIVSHAEGHGPEPWLNEYVDFGRVFLAGDSAGANIANYVAIQAGIIGLANGVKVLGLQLVHPFFVGEGEDEKMYRFLSSSSSGRADDPVLNPSVDPTLGKLGCKKVLICVAEKDRLRDRGQDYFRALKESGWGGKLEFHETKGEDHSFHKFKDCEEKVILMMKLFVFVNEE